MSAVAKFQMGAASETTWNSGQTVSRFFEIVEEKVQPDFRRIVVPGLRAGSRAMRADRSVPYFFEAAGSFKMPVLSNGFGFWLVHMLGTVSSGTPTAGLTQHRASAGDLLTRGFTWQVNRATHPGDVNQAFTFTGGKIHKWAFECAAGDALIAEFDVSFAGQDTSTSLVSASYPAGPPEGFTFVGADVQISSSSVTFQASNFKLSCDNKLDRGSYLRSSPTKKEPVQVDLLDVQWELEGDFIDLTQRNRFASNVSTGTFATIVATFTGQVANASGTFPSIRFFLPSARFDGDDPNITGPDPLHYKVSGIATLDATLQGPVYVEYNTTDQTP